MLLRRKECQTGSDLRRPTESIPDDENIISVNADKLLHSDYSASPRNWMMVPLYLAADGLKIPTAFFVSDD